MREELSDREIIFSQRLLKQQFGHVNSLCSILLQDKPPPDRIQIIFCQSYRHWIIATTINSNHDTVKVYDFMLHYLDKDSLTTIEKRFTCNGEVPTVKMTKTKQPGCKKSPAKESRINLSHVLMTRLVTTRADISVRPSSMLIV